MQPSVAQPPPTAPVSPDLGGAVGTTRGRRGDRAAQRQRILDALFTVMSSSGVSGASVSEIADAAGIARGALHYYFENKDELVASLMRRLGDAYLARLGRLLEKLGQGDDATRADAVAALGRWHFAGDSDEAARLLAVWIDYWGQAATNPAIGAVVFEVQEGAREACVQAIALSAPTLSLDDDARRLLAASVLAVIEGGLLQWRVAAQTAQPFARVPFGDAIGAAAAAVVRAAETSTMTSSLSADPSERP